MNIEEALRARRDGASVDSVLDGLIEGHNVKPTVYDHYRQLCEEEEAGGDKKSGGITGPMVDAAMKVADDEGDDMAGAAVKKMMDELPDGVKAAYDALSGADSGGMEMMDYPAPDAGGMDYADEEGGGEEAEPFDMPDEGGEGEEAPPVETDLEGATSAAGDEGETNPDITKHTAERLERQLGTALQLGESLLRRALRYKAERDHFQNQLGLTESESNLDFACPDGYCYDLRENACVKVNSRMERLINEMVMDETSDGQDPLQGDKSSEGGDGTTYDEPTGADPGKDDPMTGDKAATGGVGSGQFTKGGKDPMTGGKGSMAEDASPHTFQSMNSDGDGGHPAATHIMSMRDGHPLPADQFVDNEHAEAPSHGGGDDDDSKEESLSRMGARHTINPLNEHFHQEPRDAFGRLIEEAVPQGRQRIENQQKMQDHRYNISAKKLEAHKAMVAEALQNYGIYKGTAIGLANRYLTTVTESGIDAAMPILREMAGMAPAGDEGAMMSDVYAASGDAAPDMDDDYQMPGELGGAPGMMGGIAPMGGAADYGDEFPGGY